MAFNPYDEVPASPPFSPQSALSPNRVVREKYAYRADTSELKALPTLSAHTTTPAHDIGYYPASLCVLFVWLVFVVLLLWLLESAVKHGPESLSQPWAYTTLPSLLITVFAQGHAAVTAMHLSRVSVSALHSVRTSPSTWAEVFWISDRAWQGPVGILSTFFAASRLRVRTSAHFVLCAVTCLTALVTPIILSRAYPIRTITVNEDTMIAPLALSVTRMGAVDAYAEIGTGTGSWTTALSVADTYNSSVYLPPGASRNDDPLDFFFAGNVQGTTTRIPGLRLSGQCAPVQTTVSGLSDFPAYCTAQIPDVNTRYLSGTVTITPPSTNLTLITCCNATWNAVFSANGTTATNFGYIYVQSTNASAVSTTVPGSSVSGVIRCDTRFSTGNATLSGATGTYSNFTEVALYQSTQGGEPLLDPLYALFYYLGYGSSTNLFTNDDSSKAAVVRALGYTGISLDGSTPSYTQPSLDEIATGFWRGVSYNVAGLGLLSRSNDTLYPAVQSGQTSVYVREKRFAIAAYVLLATWLLLLLFITGRSFRPTFGGSFDSYITAKLVMDKPGLVDHSRGDLASNENLRAPFFRIGRDESGRVVVAEE
ncbi:hypothetical protein DFH08DRAFT_773261 [Mycena albidolilacea]|uniref:Uncharacterized protein n=1 Tax=Mycena albidolilacea TaxID=1033008 RepID=A0AAD7AE19_9AGAR|nr:hypothetical protein DFH08DRAFT_773261 [Mycena albidolilacea]